MLDAARFAAIADELTALQPDFDRARFLKLGLTGLDALSLMQRLRRMSAALHATLPPDYRAALQVLRALAPRIGHRFATLVLPDYVGCYGLHEFELSMQALEFFTAFGSSEFGVRPFLRADPVRALAIMERWSRSPSDAVRRLASEGCRPRLPWSFRLAAIAADPALAAPILDNLRADTSLYVRKSVANHLNDISRAHPDWLLARLAAWPREDARTAWIVKHALRSLIKAGNPRALALIGAHGAPEVAVDGFAVSPAQLALGQRLSLSFELASRSAQAQRLVVDYRIHYVKKSGARSAKVFKLKELTLAPGQRVALAHRRQIRDFTTRVHYAGRHALELLVNGACVAQGFFDLSC
jgi:3-methyladenine DNA glycosylase AlkC